MSGISPWEGRICSITQTVARHMKGYSPACPGLCFSALLPRLSLCEKALAEYLDMKRLAFPRFYFVSSADLLDILSNGTNPQLVSLALCHLHIFQLSVMSRWKMLSRDSAVACSFLSALSPTLTGINNNSFTAGLHLSSLKGNVRTLCCPICPWWCLQMVLKALHRAELCSWYHKNSGFVSAGIQWGWEKPFIEDLRQNLLLTLVPQAGMPPNSICCWKSHRPVIQMWQCWQLMAWRCLCF